MHKKIIVLFVHCYGLWDFRDRDPVEMVGYKQYLEGILRFIEDALKLEYEIGDIYFVGGMVGIAGESVESFWRSRFERLVHPGLSHTSPFIPRRLGGSNHLECAQAITRQLPTFLSDGDDRCPIYFVDEVRRELVQAIFEKLDFQCSVVGIPRHDVSPKSTWDYQAKQLAHFRETGELLP